MTVVLAWDEFSIQNSSSNFDPVTVCRALFFGCLGVLSSFTASFLFFLSFFLHVVSFFTCVAFLPPC